MIYTNTNNNGNNTANTTVCGNGNLTGSGNGNGNGNAGNSNIIGGNPGNNSFAANNGDTLAGDLRAASEGASASACGLRGEDIPMDWDTPLEDGEGPDILPEGDYNFTVRELKRGRFPGSAKIPPCNEAEIALTVETDRGLVAVRFNLLLISGMKWRIASFFRSVGLKKPGETCRPDWKAVTGRAGRAHFKPRDYINASGQQRQANSVAYFIDYDPAYFRGTEGLTGFTPVEETLPF